MSEDVDESVIARLGPYLTSPTIDLSLLLIAVYVVTAILGGDFAHPFLPFSLVQCDGPLPIYPWTLVTSIFLHANVLHIGGNVLFLLVFGLILEEQVTKSRWVATFFLTGVAGNLTVVGADLVGFLLTGLPNMNSPDSLSCGVGASGAIYGLLGAAAGLRSAILIVFIFALNLFAGGGFFAHVGGLIPGLLIRRFWNSDSKTF